MKKAVIIACLASLGLVILIKSGVIDSLILFLLAGIIPGTNYAVPSNVMLIIIIGVVWLLVMRFAAIELFLLIMEKRATVQKTTHKKRLPKRRYSQI